MDYSPIHFHAVAPQRKTRGTNSRERAGGQAGRQAGKGGVRRSKGGGSRHEQSLSLQVSAPLPQDANAGNFLNLLMAAFSKTLSEFQKQLHKNYLILQWNPREVSGTVFTFQ